MLQRALVQDQDKIRRIFSSIWVGASDDICLKRLKEPSSVHDNRSIQGQI